MSNTVYPELPFLPFFTEKDRIRFFSYAIIRHLDAGECIGAEGEKDAFYFILNGSGKLVNNRQERILSTGEWFGVRPFCRANCFTRFTAHFPSTIAVISSRRFSELLISDFTWYRGYCNTLRFSADSQMSYACGQNCEIVAVTGKAGSGKTHFVSSMALSARGQKVLILHSGAANSSSALALLSPGKTTEPQPLPVTSLSSESIKRAVEFVDEKISFIDISLLKDEIRFSYLNTLIYLMHRDYDLILFEFDADSPAAAVLAYLCDSLFFMITSKQDSKLKDDFCLRHLRRGQYTCGVTNQHFIKDREYLIMRSSPGADRDSLCAIVENIESYLERKRSCLIITPALFSSIHLYRFFSERFSDFPYTMISSSLYSAVVAWFFLKSVSVVEFRHLMRKFFAPDMQKIFFSVHYPDRSLYSSRYIRSFFSALSRKKSVRDLGIIFGLSDGSGEQLLLHGNGEGYASCAMQLYPWVSAGGPGLPEISSQRADSCSVYKALTLNLHDCTVLSVKSTSPVSPGLPAVTETVAKSFDSHKINESLRNIVIDVKGGIYSIREDL